MDTSTSSEVDSEMNQLSLLPHLKHLAEALSLDKTIEDKYRKGIRAVCAHLPETFYVAPANASAVLTLLKNVVECFDTKAPVGARYRRCNVILGLKNTGKSTLVENLGQAVKKWAGSKCITLFINGTTFVKSPDTFATLLYRKCKKRNLAEFLDPSYALEKILKTLRKKHSISTLIVVDEAQDLYPRKQRAVEPQECIKRTHTLVGELCTMANQPGSVAWLTGSSQALRSLYKFGEHPDYLGAYFDLNDKKFWSLNYVGLRDPQSITELFAVAKGRKIDSTESATLFQNHGGCIGDLLSGQGLQEDILPEWPELAWRVVEEIAHRQPPTNAEFPWNLRPITPGQLMEVIRIISEDLQEQQIAHWYHRLCDLYVLERDSTGNYSLAYPSVIVNYTHLYAQYRPDDKGTARRYLALRTALKNDDIGTFLKLTLEAMYSVPFMVNQKIRKFEAYPHSIVHVLLWLCHTRGSYFNSELTSQEGRLDVIFVNKYRHYIELKNEDSSDTAEDACNQIFTKHYNISAPLSQYDQQKPAFFYGVKWTARSTSISLHTEADEEAKKCELWSQIRNLRRLNLHPGL